MMATRMRVTGVTISAKTIVPAMQSNPVRAALKKRADGIASRAKRIADTDGADTTISRTDGTRPKGRPYSRISSSNAGTEWGDSTTKRARVLGRAI